MTILPMPGKWSQVGFVPVQLIAAGAIAAASFGAAWHVQSLRMDAERGEMAQRAAKDLAVLVERQDGAATAYEVFKERERVVYQTITKTVDRIVDRPVYRDTVCFQPDGMRALADAIHGRNGDPGEPTPALP